MSFQADYYTAEEIAKLIEYIITTVLNYSRKGLLPPYVKNSFGISRKKFWCKTDIDACLARIKQTQNQNNDNAKSVEQKQLSKLNFLPAMV